ncbi:MAG: L-threonylcarbamoyladenylate synthase, partial [Proteobacteria bacterium]|nr:L-threonylcarbamoyladenylate synthase [Pseudomonadota bacterium]
VAFPTETVYGLAADAANPAAVAKIFAAKGRPADHPLIVHLPDAAALDAWAREVPPAARQLAAAFWPGPLTLILKRQPQVLDAVTGGQDTVGLRVPNHPLALALLRAFSEATGTGAGLAAPSANRYGRISPTSAAHVRAELGARVPLVLDGGDCAVGIESTIIDLSGSMPRVLRPGAITAADIARVLGEAPLAGTNQRADTETAIPRVAGSDKAHYAPLTPLRLVASDQLQKAVNTALAARQRPTVLARTVAAITDTRLTWHGAASDVATYAHDLYARLRTLDALACDLILVESPPMTNEWLAVADRLQHAACGSGQDDET